MQEIHPGVKINVIADIVKVIHISLILYILLGWVINNHYIWYSILIMIPLLQIHWKMNQGVCFLTTIENKLRNRIVKDSTFIGELSKKIFKKELNDSMVDFIIYFGMYSSASICIIRLLI